MSDLQIGEQAPDFSLPRDGGELVTLDDFHGHFLILYFYPKDDTPGCTLEATEFSAMKSKIELNTVFGSRKICMAVNISALSARLF